MSLDVVREFLGRGEDSEPVPVAEMDIEDFFYILDNDRRRYLVEEMIDGDVDQYDVADVTEAVTTRDFGEDWTRDERKAVYVSLYQQHLPMMDDKNLIDYEKTEGVFEPGENFPILSQNYENLNVDGNSVQLKE